MGTPRRRSLPSLPRSRRRSSTTVAASEAHAHCVSFRPRWRRWHETRRRKEELQACVSFRPRWRRWRETRRLRASAERTQKEKTNPTASAAALVPAAGGGNAAPPDLTVTIPNGQKEARTAKKESTKFGPRSSSLNCPLCLQRILPSRSSGGAFTKGLFWRIGRIAESLARPQTVKRRLLKGSQSS